MSFESTDPASELMLSAVLSLLILTVWGVAAIWRWWKGTCDELKRK